MPQEYEKIRDVLVGRGKPLKDAKSEAAAIYNKRHPDNPVGRYSEGRIKNIGGKKG